MRIATRPVCRHALAAAVVLPAARGNRVRPTARTRVAGGACGRAYGWLRRVCARRVRLHELRGWRGWPARAAAAVTVVLTRFSVVVAPLRIQPATVSVGIRCEQHAEDAAQHGTSRRRQRGEVEFVHGTAHYDLSCATQWRREGAFWGFGYEGHYPAGVGRDEQGSGDRLWRRSHKGYRPSRSFAERPVRRPRMHLNRGDLDLRMTSDIKILAVAPAESLTHIGALTEASNNNPLRHLLRIKTRSGCIAPSSA
ncbi:hypothetical protein CUPL110328_14015 [Cupriavidus plantarum]|nr:hypothetical protein LMG26296_03609 [Cupriavidus plantarum]SMR85976.1 hypothetical protein SAMN05421735_4795 [Cupriavidus plantarum]